MNILKILIFKRITKYYIQRNLNIIEKLLNFDKNIFFNFFLIHILYFFNFKNLKYIYIH